MAETVAETADTLRAEIEAVRQEVHVEEQRTQELDLELEQADERQRLRRELEHQRALLEHARLANTHRISTREAVDVDRAGYFVAPPGRPSNKQSFVANFQGGGAMTCGKQVAHGEFVWKITNLSWFKDALWADYDAMWAVSQSFKVGEAEFVVVYNPDAGNLPDCYRGSLAIRHWPGCYPDTEAFSLHYNIHIKSPDGNFVQWGPTGHGRYDPAVEWPETVFGPDVHWRNAAHLPALGILGLSHEQLLESEWVQDDVLTVKCVLEVRPGNPAVPQTLIAASELPGSTIASDLEALLEKATNSDVQFMVQDEVIHAHSLILCARSEVFHKQLTSGMQESVTKVITIEDCPAPTFRNFLKFLYTDSLPSVEGLPPSARRNKTEQDDGGAELKEMQALLAVSNKYQLARLQHWCEAQVSERLCTSAVCGILCQAHLLQAHQLEHQCLAYIKSHMTEVVKQPAYMDMMKTWPEVMMKVSLFMTGVVETEATEVLNAYRNAEHADSEGAPADSSADSCAGSSQAK